MRGGIPAAQCAMLSGMALAIPLSGWHAYYPPNTWLQVGPVGFAIVAAIPILRRWPISNAAMACITAFMILHMFAAHWEYSYVPYRAWLTNGLGFDLDKTFGFRRDMFDRLVHFLFGVLMVRPLSEISIRHGRTSRNWGLFVALLFVFGVSSLYEIFEWTLTIALSPNDAGAYNGEQGDAFDSQKDMACAAVGAAISAAWLALRKNPR